jgi:hypothetical protein
MARSNQNCVRSRVAMTAGGLGILVGDGKLPNPGVETVIETYYAFPLSSSWRVTLDYQFVANPAFNEDRGPVSFARKLAGGDHQPIGRLRSGKLIDPLLDLFGCAAKVDRLTQEIARHPRVRKVGADLVGLAAGEGGHAERAAQSEALIDLW